MNWQKYVNENINMNGRRGYVFDDDLPNFYKHSVRLLNAVWSECCNPTDKKILDVGCGNGRLPIALTGEDIHIKTYTGIDIVPEAIEFCKKAFVKYPHYNFFHIPIQNNRYAPNQKMNLDEVELPEYDYDIIVANSVFTHLGGFSNAVVYLKKLKNALVDNGLLYATWFKSPPYEPSNSTKKTVYKQSDILQLYYDLDLTVVRTFGGVTTTSVDDQWRIVARK